MRLWFYLNYALRNLWRSRRWSAFAVFSVAAGVATMVALRSLGLSIGDSLTADARSANKGDITISTRNERIFSALTAADDNSNNFSDDMLRRLAVWTADRGGTLTGYRFNSGAQLTKVGAVTAGRSPSVYQCLLHRSTVSGHRHDLCRRPRRRPSRRVVYWRRQRSRHHPQASLTAKACRSAIRSASVAVSRTS